MKGNSGRAVGRILGIWKNMCLYWIRKYAKNIEPKETPNTRVNIIEMDELYSFVERKNRFYAMTLVSRDAREIVGFDISFRQKSGANSAFSRSLREGASILL